MVNCLPSGIPDRRDATHHVRNPFRNFSRLPLLALSKSPLNSLLGGHLNVFSMFWMLNEKWKFFLS